MYHYTYLILGEDGRFYYGHRSCDCDPRDDEYMGSCRDSSFKPKKKRILKEFSNLDLAIIEEMRIHVTKDVGPNPRYANGVTMRPNGMSRRGVPVSVEARQKMSTAHAGKSHSEETKQKLREKQKGIPKSNAHRKNMSKARSGLRRFLTEDGRLIYSKIDQAPPNSKIVSAWKTKNGETVWTTKDDAKARGLRYASLG